VATDLRLRSGITPGVLRQIECEITEALKRKLDLGRRSLGGMWNYIMESKRKHSGRNGVQKVKVLLKSRELEEIWTVGFGSRTKESAQEKIIS